MLDVKLIKSFVERVEALYQQRSELDAQLSALYREMRGSVDKWAIKDLVRRRRHGSCGEDLLTEYCAVARNLPAEPAPAPSCLDQALDG
jgi:Uncharacterized protein conserved in bacteria (DUF2312)